MATAGDQINGALRLLGVLAEGESPSSETSADALLAMQQMIDSWNTERLSVYATQDQTFSWTANNASRTLGPTGDFVGTRPIQVMDSTYFKNTSSGISYNINLINELQYNTIALKTVTSTFPQVLWVNMTYPDITMTVYPVPTTALEFHFISVVPLTSPVGLATDLAFPPGYLRAFRYNLACEIAPEFGVEPSGQVQRIAMASKRDLKRINNPDDVMALPAELTVRRIGFNVYTGGYN